MTAAAPVTTVEVATSQGQARAELTLPGGPGAPSFLLALTHGAGGRSPRPICWPPGTPPSGWAARWP